MSQWLELDLHPFLLSLEKIRQDSRKPLWNSAEDRFGTPRSLFIFAICTGHFIYWHQLWICRRVDFISLWPNSSSLVASLDLHLRTWKRTMRCSEGLRWQPGACQCVWHLSPLTTDTVLLLWRWPTSWCLETYGDFFLPKKPSPCARDLAN